MSDSNSTNRPNDGGPAFPQPASEPGSSLLDAMFGNGAEGRGMSLRAYIATQVHAALIGCGAGGADGPLGKIAALAVAHADALIEALEDRGGRNA